jgi:hypothetical protein
MVQFPDNGAIMEKGNILLLIFFNISISCMNIFAQLKDKPIKYILHLFVLIKHF